MNARRGFFRTWIFFSVLWVAGWGIYVWVSRIAAVDQMGRAFVAYHTDFGDGWTEPKDFSALSYLGLFGIGLGIPVAILALGASLGWVAGGFCYLDRNTKPDERQSLVISDNAKWHWGEGNKYVIEGGKASMIANGAAAISILTFVGQTHQHYMNFRLLLAAMVLFACGTLASAIVFACAYCTQLQYGNSRYDIAVKWHRATYVVAFFSFLFFAAGIASAAWGFSELA